MLRGAQLCVAVTWGLGSGKQVSVTSADKGPPDSVTRMNAILMQHEKKKQNSQ